MNRVLMLASVASMIDQFNMSNITLLQSMGYNVDVACNFEVGNTCTDERVQRLKQKLQGMGVRYFQVDFARDVTQMVQNMKALKQVMQLMRTTHYTFCHCHSPIGGVVARIAGHATKTKIIYTAHGFHFFKGAPIKNWLIFYPIEKLLSWWTDVLITINQEDHCLAENKFHMKRLEYVPGVGIETERKELTIEQKREKRNELGIPRDAFLIINVAEFTANKNQKTVIKAMEQWGNSNAYFVMCGIGEQKAQLEQYVREHRLEENIRFVGFRNDIHEIYQAADCFVLSSFREGMSVALMEAMAEGLPIVCGRIRGNVDLITDGEGGILLEPGDMNAYQEAFAEMYQMKHQEPETLLRMGKKNQENAKNFGRDVVEALMRKIYCQ